MNTNFKRMNNQTLLELPARLQVSQAAKILGFQEYEIPILVRLKLLKPLGNPAQNGHKYFSKVQILELAEDPDWLDRATRAIARFFQQRNRKTEHPSVM